MAILKMFRNDGKIGYRNENNELIVDAFFDEGVYSFGSGSETRCPFGYVAIDGRFGIINEMGRIVEQLEYQDIQYMLDNFFLVKKVDKWGVLDAETKEMVVPIGYDQINWEKGYNVLVCKGDRWGAISILTNGETNLSLIKANIPIEYLEIKILDEEQRYYGVKRETRDEENQLIQGYTILDAQGKQLPGFEKTKDFDSQFDYYTENLILTSKLVETEHFCRYNYHYNNRIRTSIDRKWGFMSIRGITRIPFKYDRVERRKDGNFDVCINDCWGVLSPSGKEIVAVKYYYHVPPVFKDAIVQDSISKCFGILNEDGSERIPTIYEHLEVKDGFIYFGYGGYSQENIFSGINEAKWGCMNQDGKEIIPPIYDCYLVQDGVILAGYDGKMVGASGILDVYTGVFDMYSYQGELIFGGFHEVYIKDDYYYFLFGATWADVVTNPFSVENTTIYKYSVKGASWLVLDKNLVSRKVGKNGKQIRFKKGGRVVIRTVEEEEKTIHYYNFDVSVLESDKEIIEAGGSGLDKIIMEAYGPIQLYPGRVRSNKYFNCSEPPVEIGYYDDDYAGTTWDAMTDGMYGDEPDGFDGDYSFMGRG